jgi:hypothetical protein
MHDTLGYYFRDGMLDKCTQLAVAYLLAIQLKADAHIANL